MGALECGRKELIAVVDGYRESKESWRELLADLKTRGLAQGPKLAIGDGGLGFWSALAQEFPAVQGQRCWVHKTANVLDKMPKSIQHHAKKRIHDIYLAPTKDWASPFRYTNQSENSFCLILSPKVVQSERGFPLGDPRSFWTTFEGAGQKPFCQTNNFP